MSQGKPSGDTNTKRLVWIICGIAISLVLLLPWWFFSYRLLFFDSVGISIAIFLVLVVGGVWAVLNTRRGIPRLLWVIGGIVATVLTVLFFLLPVWVIGWVQGMTMPGAPRGPTYWINMILFSTIMIPMGFGAVWAVYGLVLFCQFVWGKVRAQVKTKR